MPRKPRQLPAQNTLPYLLLTLTALCGEYPIRQISHLPGGSAYLESVVTALRRDGLLRTFSKDGLRGLRLTSSAKRLLLADAPEWFSAYLTGSSEPNKLKSEIPRRLRLHRMAEILTIMHNADIPAFPWEKVPFSAASQSAAIPAYYTSREVKEIGPQGAKIKSSRATGILLTDGGIFLTYNTAKAQMKWEYKAELRFKALLQTEGVMPDAEISGIVFGSTMEQLSILTQPDAHSYFLLDGSFPHFYYLTNDRYGEAILRLLCDTQQRRTLDAILADGLHEGIPNWRVENDAIDSEGNPVLFAYKGDIPGSLFMAAQTYVWDHQTFKGEGDGDIDGGGYANADTYEMYLGYIDWMLKEKAKEDAEFQRQIEEYAEQGIIATVVEDEAAKWAVYAKSSVKGRQAFFNYYAPRKLVTNTSEPGKPPAGDADITLRKVAAGTTRGLDGAKFNIYRDGQIVGSDVTQNGGIIEVKDVTKGLWSFVETEAPEGYCADSTSISVYVDTTDGDKQYTVTAENYALPDMKITKRDAMSGKPIAGTVFSVKSVTGSYSTSVTTGTDGSATLSAIPAGVYVVREESVPEPYIVTNTEQTVALRPGKTSEVTFVDYEKPGLEIIKKNIANGEPIEGVTYRIEQIDGSFSTSATTDNHGRIFLDSVPVGTFKVTEINVPSHVILCPIPQEVALKPGETSTVTFFNALKPSLEIRKVDSVTGDPIKGAKFQIWYGSNHTDTGELNDLGTYFSGASGKIILPEIKDGWYKVTELEPASGYAIKEPATQECFISGGESKVLTFENTPLSAIIIRKVDSESGQPLEGAWFRIRYLGGTSGTGGTVVGEIKTSQNGTAILTGLAAGTYVCEEISAPDGYVITDAAETVYLSGKDQDVITVTFGNDKMGSLLIVKKDAVTGAPISDVEFFITDSDGSVIGNANGKYVTDSAGTIRIDGLTPGMTVIAREVRAKDGYILDDTPQSIKIKRNSVMTLEFRNQPKGGVLVKKVDAVTNAPISDVEFLVTDSDGNLIGNSNGKFVTDSAGTFTITDIAPGTTLVIKETRAKAGYILDDTPQTVKVKSNEVVTVEFRNQPKGNLIIVKQDSVTKEPLEGVEFKIVYADGSYVDAEGGTLSSTGLYWTDKEGKITISGISGTIVVTEVQTIPGYAIDENTRTQTVVVNPNDTQTLHFYNTPIGGVEIIKVNEDMLLWFLAAGGDGHRLIFGGCDEVGAYMELTLWHNTAHAESFQFYLSNHPCPGYAE